MATLDIDLLSTYIVPIVVYTAICCALTLAIALGFCKLFCKDEWFEKAIMAFGVGTGNTATGLALVRAVDPRCVQRSYVLEGSIRRSRSDVDDDRRRNDDGRRRSDVCDLHHRGMHLIRPSEQKDGIKFRTDSAGLNIYKIS